MADIDLTNPDSRKTYLKENLGHLMEGIDSNYGQVLMDELMRRMEATVSEFNDEVKAMLGKLQGIAPTPPDNILASGPRPEPQAAPAPPPPPQAAPAQAAPEPREPRMEVPEPAPELPEFETAAPEPEPFVEPEATAAQKNIKEVEIEVDLPEDQLSDFEKKLKSIAQ